MLLTSTEIATAILATIDAPTPEKSLIVLSDAPIESPLPDLALLLADARAAHQQYRQHLPHRELGSVVAGDAAIALDWLKKAANLRAQAELLDPKHLDPSWGSDMAANHPHTEMLEFYLRQLGINGET